jgi:hypothetical protein
MMLTRCLMSCIAMGFKITITNSTELTSSRETDGCCGSWDIPHLLWNPKVHYRVQESITGPYNEPSESWPLPHNLPPLIVNRYRLSFCIFQTNVSQQKLFMHLYSLPARKETCHKQQLTGDGFEFYSWPRREYFLFSTAPSTVQGLTQPPIQWAPGVNGPGPETGRSLPS